MKYILGLLLLIPLSSLAKPAKLTADQIDCSAVRAMSYEIMVKRQYSTETPESLFNKVNKSAYLDNKVKSAFEVIIYDSFDYDLAETKQGKDYRVKDFSDFWYRKCNYGRYFYSDPVNRVINWTKY